MQDFLEFTIKTVINISAQFKYKPLEVVALYVCIIILKEFIFWGIDKLIYIFKLIVLKFFDILDRVVLGKRHKRTMEYSRFILLYFKLRADLFYYLHHMHIPREFYFFVHFDMSDMEFVRFFSVHNFILFIRNALSIMLRVSLVHTIALFTAVYVYYRDQLFFIYEMLKNIGADYGKVSFFVSLISIVCLIVYALWDANYRVEAYAEMRKDYYKKLKRDEEELLDVLCGIRQSLEKNIDIMVKNKRVLLEEGAYALSGKRCSIDGNTITIIEEFQYGFIDGCFEFVNELDDCNDLFNRLGEIYADMVKCGLLNADIYNLKDDIPLLLQMKFWGINKNDFESEQLRCFSKNSMIKWCHNWFEEYLITEKYPWGKVKERITDASIILDYVLLDSLELELYLEECIKTIIAGFSKENIFYRLKIGK